MFQHKHSFLKRLTGLRLRPALLAIGAAAALGGAAVNGEAAPLFGLFNTGIDPGVMMGVDNHYKVALEGSSAPAAVTYVTDLTDLPYTPNDNLTSRFVSPQKSYVGPVVDPAGVYDFTTTFDLTGVNLSLVTIQGRFESDDYLNDILINGHSLGIAIGAYGTPGYFSFSNYYSLVPNASFLNQGVNTLTFKVTNVPGTVTDPVTLRAEFLAAVPEPSVYASVVGLAAVASMGFWLRRRRATV